MSSADEVSGKRNLSQPLQQARAPLQKRAAMLAKLVKPAVLKRAVVGGFTLDDFRVNIAADTVTCPAGHTTRLLPPGGRHQQRKAWFTAEQCASCPLRARCTTARRGRVVTWRPQHHLQGHCPTTGRHRS
ncbi:transposase [Streptomyces sp. NPDC020096]